MAKKKHPILTVLIILAGLGVFLGGMMALVLNFFAPSGNLAFGEKIAVIPINGSISESHAITSELVKFRRKAGVKAIILRIDSPGGGVGASQEIYREVKKTARTKRVVASMGGVAASGGYYIASAADKIVANPGTITGSIGVLMQFVQFQELMDKIGVHLEVLKSGEFKDTGSPHRELNARDKELLQGVMEDIQRQFVEDVAQGRGLSLEKVEEIADGRIFTGARAKELGLVDVLGNFHDAVDIAKSMTGIRGEVQLIYPEEKDIGLWDILFESAAESFTKAIQGMKSTVEYRWSGRTVPATKENY